MGNYKENKQAKDTMKTSSIAIASLAATTVSGVGGLMPGFRDWLDNHGSKLSCACYKKVYTSCETVFKGHWESAIKMAGSWEGDSHKYYQDCDVILSTLPGFCDNVCE